MAPNAARTASPMSAKIKFGFKAKYAQIANATKMKPLAKSARNAVSTVKPWKTVNPLAIITAPEAKSFIVMPASLKPLKNVKAPPIHNEKKSAN